MLALTVFLTCLLIAAFTGVLATISDVRGLTIPNVYSLIVIAAFAVCWGVLWFLGEHGVLPSLFSSLLAAVIFFAVSLALYAWGMLGAADSKLGTAYALWVGVSGLPPFLVYMTLAGGVLGIVALVIQKRKPFAAPLEGSWVHQVQNGKSKVPYGIAIVLGVLASFAHLGYFEYETFAEFLR